MKRFYVALILTILVLLAYPAERFVRKYFSPRPRVDQNENIEPEMPVLADPVAQFSERVTKKPFGIYITPKKSPVQPERFTGFHTGADTEYEDITADVPVFAVSDGIIKLARPASGYGGVICLEITLNGKPHTIIYGHIRPNSLPVLGKEVKKGEQIGFLGTGYSPETDNERRHLHFAVLSDNRIDLRGYVQDRDELREWIDPITLY